MSARSLVLLVALVGCLKGTSPHSEIWERQNLAGLEDWNDRLDERCGDDRSLWD